jgi:hypothetical protein
MLGKIGEEVNQNEQKEKGCIKGSPGLFSSGRTRNDQSGNVRWSEVSFIQE